MRRLVFVLVLMAFAVSVSAGGESYSLPELHVIKTVTLAPTHSCRSTEEIQKGFQESALFLSDYSRKRNGPDLVFDGACRSRDYFYSSTAGDDMALIGDLGTNVQLEKLTAHDAFNMRNVNTPADYTRFVRMVQVVEGHTYVVLLNKREIRGLFVFTVVNHVPNQRVLLRYAVKEYQIMEAKAQSEGFDWGRDNAEKSEVKQN
ncbi:MAG TPA: hypothetical protein VJS44_08550 [Pyrinomonadaceae bacterium]|nr:hypothetical protein [Pyrinomonadaceae bacterium]